MKEEDSSADLRVMLAGLALLAIAFVCWELRDFLPEIAATSVRAKAELSTIGEKDDARIHRAFASAWQGPKAGAGLDLPTTPRDQIRHSELWAVAPTEAEAVENLERTVESLRKAYTSEGGGELHINASKKAWPVPNPSMERLSLLMRGAPLVLAFLGAWVLYMAWKRLRASMGKGMPETPPIAKAAIIYIFILLFIAIPLQGVTIPGLPSPMDQTNSWGLIMLVMAIPYFLVFTIITKMREVKRAASWAVGGARITKSQVGTQRHRFASEATQIKNQAQVEYEFTVGAKTYHGDRIGIGETMGGTLDMESALKRYSLGANVPVYYDPADPKNCVLEREAPVNAGCMYAGALVIVMAGLAVAAFFLSSNAYKMLDPYFPAGAHPIFAVFFGIAGLMVLMSMLGSRAMAKKAQDWPVTPGTVVNSSVESYSLSDGERSGRRTVYQAVIEYAYKVNGREYRCATLNFAGQWHSSSRAPADALVARYPVGTAVQVHHDPENPSSAVLETALPGKQTVGSLVMAVIFFALAAWFGGGGG